MADQDGPKKRVASPGISGAIKDAVGAIAGAVAPKSITQRKQRIEGAINEDSGSPQTTDLGNQF